MKGRPILTKSGPTVDGIRHGMTGYTHHRCRCLECRHAMAEYHRERNDALAEERQRLLSRISELEEAASAK